MLAGYLEELNTFTQLCSKTSSLDEYNIYADIGKLKLAATPRKCGSQTADVNIKFIFAKRTGVRAKF